jgi:SagB-type dehydrogenase family enzyme
VPLITQHPNSPSDDRECSEDALYYLSTKLQSDYFTGRYGDMVRAWRNEAGNGKKCSADYKSYPDRPCHELAPDLELFRRIDFERIVLQRMSTRSFSGIPIGFTEFSNLLVMSAGLKESGRWLKSARDRSHWPRRALPSGGAAYPLELYVLALNIESLPLGLYHHDSLRGGLARLAVNCESLRPRDIWPQHEAFENPAALIFLTAVFERTRAKYGPHALYHILMEAGAIGTQMNLVATAMELGFCFGGSGFADKIEDLIGIDGRAEGHIVSFCLGRPAAQGRRS